MRSLLKVGLVVAIVAAFGVGTALLPGVDDEQGRTPLVAGVVVATPAQRARGPVLFTTSLLEGRPRRVRDDDTFVDVVEGEQGRFELAAGDEDGSRFFVHALVRPTQTEQQFCADMGLPRVRLADVDGDDTWVVARTGRPLAPLRLTATKAC